jgi:hypothetical protein
MTMPKRPAVGDEMVLVGHRGDRVLVRVTKVGRKYFYVEALDPKDSLSTDQLAEILAIVEAAMS